MSRSIIERLHDAQSFAYQGNSRILGLDRDIFAQVTEVKFTVYYCLIGIAQALKEFHRICWILSRTSHGAPS